MPKQIKRQPIHPKEKTNRICAILAMAASILMWGLIIFLLPKMIKTESAAMTLIFTIGYILFTASCITHCITSYGFFKATDNFTGIFQGLISLVSTLFCIFNLRFILVMLFSAFGKDETARQFIGSKTMTEFLSTQTSNWTCFVFALIIMIIIGTLGIIKLASASKKQ
ncbi:MAG: hypothetical protein K2F81_05825 [Ruminococcus sp.]|nr:hypothetical protein [Ruminococcus sp.]